MASRSSKISSRLSASSESCKMDSKPRPNSWPAFDKSGLVIFWVGSNVEVTWSMIKFDAANKNFSVLSPAVAQFISLISDWCHHRHHNHRRRHLRNKLVITITISSSSQLWAHRAYSNLHLFLFFSVLHLLHHHLRKCFLLETLCRSAFRGKDLKTTIVIIIITIAAVVVDIIIIVIIIIIIVVVVVVFIIIIIILKINFMKLNSL